MSKSSDDDSIEIKFRSWVPLVKPTYNFFVRESDHRPPYFFEEKGTGNIFVTLSREAVRSTINLNKNMVFQEGIVHYSPHTKEWVLGSIRLSEAAYETLKKDLWLCLSGIEARPVTKEHTPIEWGPESP